MDDAVTHGEDLHDAVLARIELHGAEISGTQAVWTLLPPQLAGPAPQVAKPTPVLLPSAALARVDLTAPGA